MIKRFLVAATLAVVASTTAPAVGVTTQAAAVTGLSSARCHAKKSGNHWNCITPGSYCAAAAHGKYGYAYKTGRRYKCVKYSNGRWRWKRA